MNIIDIQDDLKNFSEDQLINEMQRPSGNAPQFLVLSEITRRKRMRDDFNMRKAANEPTVAQEAVASAGVPAQGIMGMSEAMAPKAAMAQGGIGSVMSQPMKSQMPQPTPMPQDGIMAMASGGSTSQRIREVRMKNGKIGLFQGNTFLGTKQERDSDGDSLASQIGFGQKGSIVESIKDALGFAEGGVIEAQSGAYFPSTAELYGIYGQESTFGKDLFGSAGEIGPYQILPTTAIMPGSQIKSLFPELEAAVARGDYKDAEAAYKANKAMVDEALLSGERVEPFVLDYLDNAERILGNRDLATLAYNQGIAGTEGFSGNVLDTDYVSGVRSNMAGFESAKPKSMVQKAIDTVIAPAAASSFTPTGNIQMMLDNKSDQDDSQKELRSGRRRRRAGTDVLTEADRDVMTVADSFGGIQDALDAKAPRLSDVSGPITNPTQRRIDSMTRRMADDFGDEFGNIPDLDPKPTVTKDAEEIDLTSPKLLSEAEKRRLSRTGRLTGVTVENRTDSSTEKSDETETKKEKAAEADPNKPIYSPQAAGAVSSLESEILAMQDRMKKSAEQDKWLSLAQAGLTLMSSTNPTLLGALGEAGISGLSAMKEAESRYQEGVVDLINARAKLAKGTTGMDAGNAVSRLNKITDLLVKGKDELGGPLSPEVKARLENESRYLRREILKYPEYTTGANTPPPAS